MDYLLLLSTIVLGAASVFLLKLYDPKHIKLLNAFTGAYLLCLTVLHLLPELYHAHPAGTNDDLLIGALILAGFFTKIALDVISMGVEPGIHIRFMDTCRSGSSPGFAFMRSSKPAHWEIV